MIKNKAQMYRLYSGGAFGNKLRTWDSMEDLLLSGYTGSVTARYVGDSGGGLAHYRIPVNKVPLFEQECRDRGLEVGRIRYNESAPDDRLLIQGEVMRDHRGLVLRYSRLKTMMRKALSEDTNHAQGITAQFLLKAYLTWLSYNDIMELLDQYEGHVVEFSAYEMLVGDCRGRNTVVWEVRAY